MIYDNKFFMNKIEKVVIFGQSDTFPELIKINKKLNLETIIVTSEHQAKLMDKKKTNYIIFNSIDEKFKKFIKKKTNIKNTLFIGIGPRYIFKAKTISFFEKNFINIHNARLPFDQGGGGYSWTIMREDRIDNQCIHIMDDKIDGGPVIYNKLSIFPKSCITPKDHYNYNFKQAIKFYSEFLNKLIRKHKFELVPQVKYLSRYNPRLYTELDGLINWNLNSYDLINFINAFDDPHKGASSYLNNGNFGKLYLKKVHLHGGDTPNHPYMAGIVSRHDKNWIVVCTSSKHMLLIEEVLDRSGKNIISKIKVGDRFYSPQNELDLPKSRRVYFNSMGKKK